MNWTRMHDGTYHAVCPTFGTRYGYTVARAYAGRGGKSTCWVVHVNGQYLPNDCGPEGTTCQGAKKLAERHFVRMAREALAALQGKPLIEIL